MKNKKECVIAKKCEEFLWQSQTRKGLLRHDVPRNDLCKKKAFTLAEVLITLGIIGIVAALTIPNLQQRTNEKELVSSYLKAHSVLNNAYKEAEAVKGFKLFGLTVNQFKEYLEEHLKTVKCEEHDVCLTDGSYYDYECDENQCNYITLDTNGKKKPNQIGKDIYKFKITPNGLVSEGEKDICSGYDCGNYVLSHHKIFDGLLTGCEEYGNDGRCTQCTDGYKIENGLCSSVNTPNCKDYVGENCTSCSDGYKNNDGTCEKLNVNNCIGYTGDKCTSCENGYYAKDVGTCEIQPRYCNSMENDGSTCKLNDDTIAYKIDDLYVSKVGRYDNATFEEVEQMCNNVGMRLPTISELEKIYHNKSEQPNLNFNENFYMSSEVYPNCSCGSSPAICKKAFYFNTMWEPSNNAYRYAENTYGICAGTRGTFLTMCVENK